MENLKDEVLEETVEEATEETPIVEETTEEAPVEEVAEDLAEHEEDNTVSFASLQAEIAALREGLATVSAALDDYKSWMNDFVNGTAGTLSDGEPTAEEEPSEVDEADAEFYAKQKRLLEGGNY